MGVLWEGQNITNLLGNFLHLHYRFPLTFQNTLSDQLVLRQILQLLTE